ncbi:MAG: efflux RND transporter periplasmic adaptor subunit, partial [Acidobacteriota bacterium]
EVPGELLTTRVIERDITSKVLARGIVKPQVGAQVRVGSKISGVVEKLYANIGDRVEKGDLIAVLESKDLEARWRQAEASLEKSRAALQLARWEFERARSLFDQNLIPRSDYERAQSEAELAARALSVAQAELDYSRSLLGYTRIHAPIGGVIASVSTQEGETVAAGITAPTFVTIVDLQKMEANAYVDETDIGRIEKLQEAVFTVDTYPERTFKAQVEAINPQPEIIDNVVNYIVRLSISSEDMAYLLPEMTVNATIFVETKKNRLVVPRNALHRENGGRYIYVLREGRVEKKEIQTGSSDEEFVEITFGARAGEIVILSEVGPSGQPLTDVP